MKKNRILSFFAAAILIGAGACSSDTLDPGKEQGKLKPDTSGGVYMAVDFKIPDGSGATRSETTEDGGSTGGTEIGTNDENNVTTALIVIASTEAKSSEDVDLKEYGYIVAGEVQNNRITYLTDRETKQYRATARLQKENLNTLYSLYWNDAQQTYDVPPVYVFVFCNPTKELVNLFDPENIEFGSADWIKTTCRVSQGDQTNPDFNVGIWGANSFLMNNVSLAKRLLPDKLLDWEYFTSVDRPFHLSDKQDVTQVTVDNSRNEETGEGGSVLVERSVARFDFKDGSAGQNKDNKANTYDVLFLTNEEGNIDNSKPIVQVELQKMCLVNMSNLFYYLPRVSPTGQDVDITLLGKQKPWVRANNGSYSGGNYVVGPYAVQFDQGVTTKFTEYFNYPFFEDGGSFNNPDNNAARWNVVKITDVLAGMKDNYEVGTDDNKATGTYSVWRYVTENLIPGETSNQTNGISTGVVFKGKIEGTQTAFGTGLYEEDWNKGYIANMANCLNGGTYTYEGTTHTGLTGNSSLDPIIYYFSGRLYMGWRHIRQAAIQASVTINVSGEMEINRSNSLYKAVFGDGPIPTVLGSNKFMVYIDPQGKSHDINDSRWADAKDKHDSSDYLNYLKSANYAWSVWAVNDKESGDDTTGSGVGDRLENMRKAVTGSGITIFQSSHDEDYGNGYYCYYYYWNRHNDNGIDGTMGPMEFDVVRNNVYKLSVDKIARLGHPRIPDNDPNNPTPDTPDESDEIYIDVRVQIAPWVVRLNSIKF